MEFTRRNLDKLFASAKKLSAQTLLSPVDGRGGKEGDGYMVLCLLWCSLTAGSDVCINTADCRWPNNDTVSVFGR